MASVSLASGAQSSKPLAYVCAAGMDCTWEQRVAPSPLGADRCVPTPQCKPGRRKPAASAQHSSWPLTSFGPPGTRFVMAFCLRNLKGAGIAPHQSTFFFFLRHGTENIAICCWECNKGSHVDYRDICWGCWWSVLGRGSNIWHCPYLHCGKGMFSEIQLAFCWEGTR